MRPHHLRVTAFGAFAGTEEVRFDELEGLFLLHGETGAGKTTLLDAIAFALYGRVPGERGKAKRLRSDHASVETRTEVQLEATVGGRRLRITRKPEQERPKLRGTGVAKEQASVILEEATASGSWEVKSTRVGEADAEILDLMGMSADQFFQVVLLPQGQFAQFLHSGADARAELLQKLFGTDRFRAVESWLAERRRTTADAVKSAKGNVDLLLARVSQVAGVPLPDPEADTKADAGPDTAADVSSLTHDEPGVASLWQVRWTTSLMSAAEARLAESAVVVAARKASLDAALTARTEAEQFAARQRRRGATLREQAGLEAAAPAIAALRAEADAATRAAEVAPVLEAADRAGKAAVAARRGEERARNEIPDDHGTLRTASPDALRAAGDEQQARRGGKRRGRRPAEGGPARDRARQGPGRYRGTPARPCGGSRHAGRCARGGGGAASRSRQRGFREAHGRGRRRTRQRAHHAAAGARRAPDGTGEGRATGRAGQPGATGPHRWHERGARRQTRRWHPMRGLRFPRAPGPQGTNLRAGQP
jgi:hypothetical protein